MLILFLLVVCVFELLFPLTVFVGGYELNDVSKSVNVCFECAAKCTIHREIAKSNNLIIILPYTD
ncbi:hypothetical protein KUL42_41430 [Alteromonas sp. KUL42]|nr:hypothetical protein KUL42_41430 [Alteromonas sp. KUL42]